jgi:hypothetical protein
LFGLFVLAGFLCIALRIVLRAASLFLEAAPASSATPASTPSARSTFPRLFGEVVRTTSGLLFKRNILLSRGLDWWLRLRGLCLGLGAIYDLLEFFLIFLFFEKIGDVKKRVAFQANVDEGRLHSREDAGDTAFVNGSRERVFVFTLKVDFG